MILFPSATDVKEPSLVMRSRQSSWLRLAVLAVGVLWTVDREHSLRHGEITSTLDSGWGGRPAGLPPYQARAGGSA